MYDVHDPVQPRLVGRTTPLQAAYLLAADGDSLWVGDQWWLAQFQVGPELRFNRARELELWGTAGNSYRIERREAFGDGGWAPWMEVTPMESGYVLPAPPSGEATPQFFRAVVP